jgi:hypothetical protein
LVEEWRPVVGFPDYAVSNHGRIRRVVEGAKGHLPKILKPWTSNKGYKIIVLFAGGKPARKQIGRLVCEAFHGSPPSPDHHAAHGDGKPSNNWATNLRWATRAENMADCLIHGTRATGARHGRYTKPERNPRGSAHGLSKITEDDVLAIRAAPKINGSGVRLAAQYGVSPAAICMIRARKNWKHI